MDKRLSKIYLRPSLTPKQLEQIRVREEADQKIYKELCEEYPSLDWNPWFPYSYYGKQYAIDSYYPKPQVEGPIGFNWTRG